MLKVPLFAFISVAPLYRPSKRAICLPVVALLCSEKQKY